MALIDTLTDEIEKVLETSWNVRDGNVVPNSEDVSLSNGAVKIDATFLYADLAGSSKLAQLCPWSTTAKIIRAYLNCCTRLIRANGGHIRSFDGDRVMGVFKNDTKNTSAALCAREIDWMVEMVLNPKAQEKFDSIKNNSIKIKHCIGIDTGEVRAVRAGIRDNNDLIWIGKAPSFAAKLSDVRDYPYAVYISKACHTNMMESGRIVNGKNIWESKTVSFADQNETVYRTADMSKP